MKLIINADDFGMTKSINYGIIDAFKDGTISSTSMMMNMPGVDHAISLMKENPNFLIVLQIYIFQTAHR